MKKIGLIFLLLGSVIAVNAQSLKGAWKLQSGENTALIMATDNYVVVSSYNVTGKKFESTWGGKYLLNGDQIMVDVEFNTASITTVGTSQTYVLKLKKKSLELDGSKFDKIDDGTETPLAGLWRITSRAGQDGEMNPMGGGPRKTLKMITGTRFQWFAINPMSKELFGTGGGSYTLKNGKYTETIEYFPKDDTRVGVSLNFDAEVKPTEWLHSGKSSKGDPIREVWTRQ
jgi:hypothetical protein